MQHPHTTANQEQMGKLADPFTQQKELGRSGGDGDEVYYCCLEANNGEAEEEEGGVH